ncbi:MAG: DUF1552 domain-containing protein [Planctomycetota bacterium]|nr:DUF1552 domain-containing protein [Planctomycetota bacterium]
MKNETLSRRRWLRGAGVVVGLPWLESMPVWGQSSDSNNSGVDFPKRFGVMFMACGVHPEHWWAKGEGKEMELSRCLQPLDGLQSKLNVIDGLFNKNATGVGIHPGQTGNILSGAALKKGAELRGGISVDQAIANAIGQDDVVPSLVLGCEQPTTGYHETNFSMAYSSHISWQNATSPVPMEVYPSLAFDSLFENRGSQRNKSILDRITEEASALQRQASANDKAKLEEYLTSIREVEKRIDRQRGPVAKAADAVEQKGKSIFAMERPDNGLPEDIREHMRLMCDIIALAFQSNKTRVASLLLCRDISGLLYPFLQVRKPHHLASHDELSEEWERVTTYYCSQLAYLGKKLDSMPEGDGTVLDHSCLMFVNNMFSGSKHDSSKVPLLTLGGLDGTLNTGRVMNFVDRPESEKKLCSLYLSLMNRMGVAATQFGDATEPLDKV